MLSGFRKAERVKVSLPVSIDDGGKTSASGAILLTRDISTTGAFISTRTPPERGAKLIVRMVFPNKLRLAYEAVVWRVCEDGLAVKFSETCLAYRRIFNYLPKHGRAIPYGSKNLKLPPVDHLLPRPAA